MSMLLDKLEKALERAAKKEGHEKYKVVKTVPMKKSWIKAMKKVQESLDDIQQAIRKHESMERAFWALVEQDTKNYNQMCANTETQEIEFLEERDDDEEDSNPNVSVEVEVEKK